MSAAVGFDVGNSSCIVAAAKGRGVDVLLNPESNYETPAVLCFAKKQRHFGSAGTSATLINPKSTVSQIKRLIGRKYDEPGVLDEIRYLPFNAEADSNGGVVIILKYLNEEHKFTPVQILAMLLSHLKQMAESSLDSEVSDCVIGIPSYFTNSQRRAYLDAAEIAGMKPLRLMHDGAATALGYGIYKTSITSSIIVVFVDIGHSDTQVTVAKFDGKGMTILAHAFDRDLGGRDFDKVLFKHFAGEFERRYGIDVYNNLRSCLRLMAECEKLKKVLSVNSSAYLNIDCLIDDIDVKGTIGRTEFEKVSSDLLKRVLTPCKEALFDAGLGPDDIGPVELVGSGSRIPAISRVLAGFFGKDPSRTLNASECVARGLALQCAMLCPMVKVREYEVQDSFPFSVGFSPEGGPISTIFPKGHPIPITENINIRQTNTPHLEVFYAKRTELPFGAPSNISRLKVVPFQVSKRGECAMEITVCVDLHGIVTVQSASLIEDGISSPMSIVASHSEGRAKVSKTMSFKNLYGCVPIKGLANDQNLVSLEIIEVSYGGMMQHDIYKAQEHEGRLAENDRVVVQTRQKKNDLEAYVYEAREKLLGRYQSIARDNEKDEILKRLELTEEWLSKCMDDGSKNDYSEKLQELKRLLEPMENRYKHKEYISQAAGRHQHSEFLNPLLTTSREVNLSEENALSNEHMKNRATTEGYTRNYQRSPKEKVSGDQMPSSNNKENRWRSLNLRVPIVELKECFNISWRLFSRSRSMDE